MTLEYFSCKCYYCLCFNVHASKSAAWVTEARVATTCEGLEHSVICVDLLSRSRSGERRQERSDMLASKTSIPGTVHKGRGHILQTLHDERMRGDIAFVGSSQHSLCGMAWPSLRNVTAFKGNKCVFLPLEMPFFLCFHWITVTWILCVFWHFDLFENRSVTCILYRF